jgi:hypothetical protein
VAGNLFSSWISASYTRFLEYKKKIPKGGDVVQGLQVGVHVAGVTLVDKPDVILGKILFDFEVEVNE